jgi:hypothetical protein
MRGVWVHLRWVRITVVLEPLPRGTTATECRLYLAACGMPYWQRMVAMVVGGLVLPALAIVPALVQAGLSGLPLPVAGLLIAAAAFGLGMAASVLVRAEPRLLWGLIAIAAVAILAAWFAPLATAGCVVAGLVGAMSQATEHWRRLDLADRWWRLLAVSTLFVAFGLTAVSLVGAALAAAVAIAIGVIFGACAWVALKMSIRDSMASGD